MEQMCWLSPRRGYACPPELKRVFLGGLGAPGSTSKGTVVGPRLSPTSVSARWPALSVRTLSEHVEQLCAGRKIALSWFRRRDTPHCLSGAETDPSPHFARLLRPERPLYSIVQADASESQHAVLPHTTTVTGVANTAATSRSIGANGPTSDTSRVYRLVTACAVLSTSTSITICGTQAHTRRWSTAAAALVARTRSAADVPQRAA